VSADVSEEHIAICFYAGFLLNLVSRSWSWRRYIPPKRRLTLNGLDGVLSVKTALFNLYLFTCKRNSPEANYKVSTSKKKQQQNKQNTKQDSLYSSNKNNRNNKRSCLTFSSPWSRPRLERQLLVAELLRNVHVFMATEGSLPSSQDSLFVPYSEPDENSTYLHMIFLFSMYTLCPKNNGGVSGGSVSKYAKGITFNVVLFFLVSLGGVRLTESTWYVGHCWPIVPAPDDQWWLWSSWWNEDWQGKPKYSERTPVPLCPPQIPHDLTGIEPWPPRWEASD
jgi:hypothetical protein